MRDRYGGDISDFFKFSFLRAVVPDDAVLGVAWYYVQWHDGGPDGRQIEYWSEDRWRVLESVREVHVFKHSFLDIKRIDARRRKARAVLVRFSRSFARRRHLPSHAKVLSTTHLLGMISKPTVVSDRLTISVSRLGKIFFCACPKIGPWYPPSAKSFFRNGNWPNRVPRTRMAPSRS